MVNEKKNKKDEILEHLFNAGGKTLSGVKISEKTGISRVAVWKHIKDLKKSGIDIETRPRGYALGDPEDLLMPFCFDPPFRDRIYYFNKIESTMDKAKSLARQGVAHLSLCLAEDQTCGRGRLDRRWVSAKGGLWFSLILKPKLPPPMAYIYNFAASLCLARVLNRTFSLSVKVKWPNDLLLGGRKLAGLLSEMETRADQLEFLIIGIGLNVNNNQDNADFDAISLKNALGRPVHRRYLLTQFLREFEACIQDINCCSVMGEWKEHTSTIGSRVRVETMNGVLEGKATDVDKTGALIVETAPGTLSKIIYGDCFHT